MPVGNGVAGVSRLRIFTVRPGLCRGSIVPFRPGGAERSSFGAASTLDVMEAHHDLRKFIAELPIAQRCVVLSSGREADCDRDPCRVTVQDKAVSDDRAGVGRSPNGSRINNVGRLTPGAGIESPTTLTSDLTATEALQEAETEVGVAEWLIGVRTLPVRGAGQTYRSAYRCPDLGLTA